MAYTYGRDPSHFVEIPDPDVPGQTIRPDAGSIVMVRDAETLAAVTGLVDGDGEPAAQVLTQSYGYLTFGCDSPAVEVSADATAIDDEDATWWRLWSLEAVDAALAATNAAQVAAAAAEAAASDAADAQTAAEAARDAAIAAVDVSPVTWTHNGEISATLTGTQRLYNDSGRDLQLVAVRVSATDVTGSALIVDVNIDDTTVFTDQGGRPELAVGAGAGTDLAVPEVTTWPAESYLTVDVDQVGTATDLVVTVTATGSTS